MFRSAQTGPRRARVAMSLLVLPVALLVGTPTPALADPPKTATSYSADGQWRLKVMAWTRNALAYKSLGLTADVQRREWTCTGILCSGGHKWRWVNRPVDTMKAQIAFIPNPPKPSCPLYDCPPPAPPQTCSTKGLSQVECYSWAVATGIASLNARSVRGVASAVLPSGVALSSPEVMATFLF